MKTRAETRPLPLGFLDRRNLNHRIDAIVESLEAHLVALQGTLLVTHDNGYSFMGERRRARARLILARMAHVTRIGQNAT